MKSDQVEKRQILVDGKEFLGLISMDEYVIEDDVVDAPGYKKTIPLRNGVMKIPAIGAIFKVNRNSETLKELQDWYKNFETHDVTIIRTDGAGNEFARELWPKTEVGKLNAPAYDAASPVVAQAIVSFLPEDIIDLGAEA